MADNQKYYYMRLKENFFDSDELLILESMQDGYIYSNILLKLYLRSLKRNGKLMLNETIPYNADILARVTRHDKVVVETALEKLKELGLIEILDSGAIYMLNIQEYIGQSSTEADRKREYRKRIDEDKCPDKKEDKCPDISTPYKEIRVREEKELENILFNSLTLRETIPPSAGAGGSSPFTLTDCQERADEGKVNLSEDGIVAFYKRMQKDGWTIKNKPVTNLLLAMRGFAKNHKRYQKKHLEPEYAPDLEESEPEQQTEAEHKRSERKLTQEELDAICIEKYGTEEEKEAFRNGRLL